MLSSPSPKEPMYIYNIPYKTRRALQNILDDDGRWKDLAARLNWSADRVYSLNKELYRPQGSPTDKLLLEWGTTNATVDMLVFHLLQLDLDRAAELFRGLVPDEMFKTNETLAPVSVLNRETQCFNLPPPSFENAMVDNSHLSSPHEVFNQHEDSSKSSILEFTASDNFSQSSDEFGSSVSIANLMSNTHITQRTALTFGSGDTRTDFACLESSFQDLESLPKPSCVIPPTTNLKYEFSTIVDATEDFSSQHLLGSGTFGAVYVGFIAGNRFAIKKMYKDDCQDFMAEINILHKFRHKNINALCGYSVDGPSVCLLFEFMVNGNLQDRLLCKGDSVALPWQRRQSILVDAASGLHYLHTVESKPVIHGNIKSSNILLGTHFEAKICDFGLIREATGGPIPGVYTAQHQPDLLDTNYAYLPSEFLTGNHQFTVSSDVYSFGVVIYETCTGLKVFEKSRQNGELLTDYLSGYGNEISGRLKLKDSHACTWPDTAWLKTMSVGRDCTALSSRDRPTISNVLIELTHLMHKTQSVPGDRETKPPAVHQSGVVLAAEPINRNGVAVNDDGNQELVTVVQFNHSNSPSLTRAVKSTGRFDRGPENNDDTFGLDAQFSGLRLPGERGFRVNGDTWDPRCKRSV